MCHPKVKSAEDFESLDAFNKGYAVYMYGARKDEPFVPRVFRPAKGETIAYSNGQNLAMVHTVDAND